MDEECPTCGVRYGEIHKREGFNLKRHFKLYPSHKVDSELHAAHGFHGIVDHPTHMLVGEDGAERVNVTPLRRKKKDQFDILDNGMSYLNDRSWY